MTLTDAERKQAWIAFACAALQGPNLQAVVRTVPGTSRNVDYGSQVGELASAVLADLENRVEFDMLAMEDLLREGQEVARKIG